MKRIAFIVATAFCGLAAKAQTDTLKKDTVNLLPVEVRATRAGNQAPFTKTNLSKEEIESQNLGQDIPFILNQTPSVVVSSDAGNGIGYTGLRIRGSDLTRINVTLNGIPYNDPESQAVYFVDLPDFASSVSSLQIQRGVGTSSNGAGAFGATLNFSTNEVNKKPYINLFNSGGSYGTLRNTIKVGTGLINDHFTVDMRLSRIKSDGYVDRASSNLKSFYVSGAWLNDKSSVRLNVFSGTEKTYQAWNGIPESKLNNDRDALLNHYYNNVGSLYFTPQDSVNLFTADPRKYNSFLYPEQTDNYRQDHYQLFFNHSFHNNLQFSSALFLTHGEGYYQEYKYNQKYSSYGLPNFTAGNITLKRTDLVRQLWLSNNFYGGVFSLQYKKNNKDFTFGGSLNQFDGSHYGNIIWAQQGVSDNYQWYKNPSAKKDGNLYAKYNYTINRFNFLADIQYRYVSHTINGTRKLPSLVVDRNFSFVNPKAGVYYNGNHFNLYASYALAQKEPNRTDFESITAITSPKAERLHDFELGIEHKDAKANWGATAYYMLYKDQLVLSGKLNDVGEAIRINVPNSYRLGLEAWGGLQLNKWLAVNGNITVSRNELKNFTDYTARYDADFNFTGYDTLRLNQSQISFSPWLTAFGSIVARPFAGAEIQWNSKAVSKQYLDNTESENKKLNGYFVQDVRLAYSIKNKGLDFADVIVQINNIWNKKYETNGYTYSYFYDNYLVKENFYYPMAGTNVMIGLNIKL